MDTMDTNNQLPQMSMAGYLPNGMKVFLTIPIALDQIEYAYEIALKLSNTLFEKGLTLNEPGLTTGESKELIKVVMRREKPSDGTPIIDMYPEWGAGGDEPYGTYKYVHTYLNTPEQIAEFLQAAGLKSLEQIPLYDGQAPLKRSQGRKHAKEFSVPTPFYAVRKQGDEKTGSDGQPYRPWMLTRLESAMPQNTAEKPVNNAPATTKASSQAKSQENAAKANVEPIPFVAPGDKQWWPTLYKIITPSYDNPKHAVNSVQKMQKDGVIDFNTMTVAQAVEVVHKHLLDMSAYAAATFDELDNK